MVVVILVLVRTDGQIEAVSDVTGSGVFLKLVFVGIVADYEASQVTNSCVVVKLVVVGVIED